MYINDYPTRNLTWVKRIKVGPRLSYNPHTDYIPSRVTVLVPQNQNSFPHHRRPSLFSPNDLITHPPIYHACTISPKGPPASRAKHISHLRRLTSMKLYL